MSSPAVLPTIWEVPDDLWEMVACLLDHFDPPKRMGRPRMDARLALNGIIYRARTGCQWNRLPKEFGNDASVHRTQQRWQTLGIFDALWGMILSRCADLDGVDWQWQSADGCLGKARGIKKRGESTLVSARTPRIVVSRASRKAYSSMPRAVP